MGRLKIAIPQNARFGQAMSRTDHDKEVGGMAWPRGRGGDPAAYYSFNSNARDD